MSKCLPVCLLTALFLLGSVVLITQQRILAEEKKAQTFFRWSAVSDVGKLLENPQAQTAEGVRVMIAWENSFYISGAKVEEKWYGRKQFSSDSMAVGSEPLFYTDNGRGTPYLVLDGSKAEGDGEGISGQICLGQTILENGKTTENNTKQVLSVAADNLLTAEKAADAKDAQWQFVSQGTDSLGRERFLIFTASEDGEKHYLSADEGGLRLSEDGESDATEFVLYLGETEKLKVLSDKDNLEAEAYKEISQRSILPASKVITIEKNATLAVQDTLFLEGCIEVRGGTLLIREDGLLMSGMSNDNRDLTSRILVSDGGAVVVESLGKLYLGANGKKRTDVIDGQISLTGGGKLYNYGTVVVNRLVSQEGCVENRPCAQMYLGYQFSKRGWNRFYAGSDEADEPDEDDADEDEEDDDAAEEDADFEDADDAENETFGESDTEIANKGPGEVLSWLEPGCRMITEGFGQSMISASSSQVLLPLEKNLSIRNDGILWYSSAINTAAGMDKLVSGNMPLVSKKMVLTNQRQRVVLPYEIGFGQELLQNESNSGKAQNDAERKSESVSENTAEYESSADGSDENGTSFDGNDPYADSQSSSQNPGYDDQNPASGLPGFSRRLDADDEDEDDDEEDDDDDDEDDDEDDDDEDDEDEDEDDDDDDDTSGNGSGSTQSGTGNGGTDYSSDPDLNRSGNDDSVGAIMLP